MKTLRLILLLPVLPGLAATANKPDEKAAAPAGQTPPVVKLSPAHPLEPRFKQVNERIAALFQHRNQTPPPPDPRFNPFRTPGTVPITAPLIADADSGAKLPPGTEPAAGGPGPGASLTLLQQGAATLKVTGIIEIAGRAHLVINSRGYKEGDVVQALVQGEIVYLRVKEIARRSVTLSLNDAEMTLKY